MFGIGGFELFIILIFGFLIFGPEKLPDIARTVGRGIARFREAQQEVNDTLGGEKIFDPNNPEEMFKDPIEALDKIAQRHEEKKSGVKVQESSSANPGSSSAGSDPESKAASKQANGKPATGEGTSQPESFTERKARYERERAARKAAEAKAAENGAEEGKSAGAKAEEPKAAEPKAAEPKAAEQKAAAEESMVADTAADKVAAAGQLETAEKAATALQADAAKGGDA